MSEDATMNDTPIRLTRAQARAVDRYAIEVLGLPGVVLMENAGINAAAVVVDVLSAAFGIATQEFPGARVAILCGGGNNGGDGYVVARQLMGWGLSPVVYAVKPTEELTGDAEINAEAWVRLGGAVVPAWEAEKMADHAAAWADCHAVVDALLGTGYGVDKGPVRGAAAAAIAAVNGLLPDRGPRVVSLDVPSGMDADTGEVVGAGVRADVTVSFVAEKAGFGVTAAGQFTGKVVIADIGLPDVAVRRALEAVGEGREG